MGFFFRFLNKPFYRNMKGAILMTIGEFSKKYGLDIRHVNYLTDIGRIHPKTTRKGHYRDYGSEAEEEIKRILICYALDASRTEIDNYVEMFESVPASLWKDLVIPRIMKNWTEDIEKTNRKYKDALAFVKEIEKGH